MSPAVVPAQVDYVLFSPTGQDFYREGRLFCAPFKVSIGDHAITQTLRGMNAKATEK